MARDTASLQELLSLAASPQATGNLDDAALQSSVSSMNDLSCVELNNVSAALLAAIRAHGDPATSFNVSNALCILYYAAATSAMDLAMAKNDATGMASAISMVLALPTEVIPLRGSFRDALRYGLNWFYADRARAAGCLLLSIEEAIRRWGAEETPDIDILCDLGDFLFFVAWNFEASSARQCSLILPGMTALALAFQRSSREPDCSKLPAAPPDLRTVAHVVYLAMYADPVDPMTVALRHIAPALLSQPKRFRLSVYAWCNVAPDFLDWLRDLGANCQTIVASRPTDLVRAIEHAAALDPPAIILSDMNNSVPTALFARRIAQTQIFMQCGMPGWPVPNLDAVFNSFGFDPVVAGWRNAQILSFSPPWDLPSLNPPRNDAEVVTQRSAFPSGLRLIGNYGRLVKVTIPCLMAVEQILRKCPDVAFVTGGTGDASTIRDFIAKSQYGDRMHVVEGYVPGHSWGRFLELFLDTWPMTGGESCREIIAKGAPVVTIHSAEMPALDLQRDPALLTQTWDEYVKIAVGLLNNPTEYQSACERSKALATRMQQEAPFTRQLTTDLEGLLGRSPQSAASKPLRKAFTRLLNKVF